MERQRQREAIHSKLTEDAQASFDLSTDVMLRGSWLQQSATQGVLLFNMHHIASDGWSMSVLVDEFNQLYQAYAQGMDNPLTGLPLQYSDYALWQQEELAGEQLESQLSYWEGQLADAPVLHSLPLDNKRPQIRQYKGGIHDSELEGGLLAKLIQLASSQQVTPFMLMHAVLSILLAKHSNSTDIVIGTPIANRMQHEIESLIGFFVNTLALRTQLSGEIEFSEFLSKVKQVNLDAQQHQDAPRARSFGKN